MRKFIVQHFALYERVQSNIGMFFGALFLLASFIMVFMEGIDSASMYIFGFGAIMFVGSLLFIPKKTYSSLRCGKWIFSTFLLLGLIELKHPYELFESFLSWPLTGILLFELWVGFSWFGYGYFEKFPVKWNELDEEQKYDYGNIPGASMSKDQYDEFQIIKKKYASASST